MAGWTTIRVGIAVVLCGLVSVPVSAFESVEFRVPGASDDLVTSLRESSSLLAAEREETTDPQDLFAAALAEYGRMVGALYASGYYSPVVNVLIDGREAASIPPLDAPTSIGRIEVVVQPGPAFRFSQARVAPLAPETELPHGFRAGEPALSGLVQESVVVGINGWRDVGHAKAETSGQKIVADHAQQTLSADVTLAPGPRLRFGPLKIVGADRMREARIYAIAGLPVGKVFSPAELERSAERLRKTGVFRTVQLTEDEQITSPDMVGITATLVEDKLRRLSFGGEIATTEGLSVTGTWMHRNLWGGAENLSIEGSVTNIGAQDSGTDYLFGVTLSRPATFTPDTTMSLNAAAASLDETDYSADYVSVGATFIHDFSSNLSARFGLEYSSGSYSDQLGQFNLRQLSLPLGVTWDNRDDKLDATSGYYVDAGFSPFQGFGITSSGAEVTLDARAYRSLGAERRFVLAGRIQGGALPGADIATTPPNNLFYTGGSGTVRGQPFESLGVTVREANGVPFQTGGTAFVAGSIELRAMVTEKIGVVGFFDAGQVSALGFDGSSGFQSGAGLGVRYDTGFAPLRLDLAMPVSGSTGAGMQFYIGIGQSF